MKDYTSQDFNNATRGRSRTLPPGGSMYSPRWGNLCFFHFEATAEEVGADGIAVCRRTCIDTIYSLTQSCEFPSRLNREAALTLKQAAWLAMNKIAWHQRVLLVQAVAVTATASASPTLMRQFVPLTGYRVSNILSQLTRLQTPSISSARILWLRSQCQCNLSHSSRIRLSMCPHTHSDHTPTTVQSSPSWLLLPTPWASMQEKVADRTLILMLLITVEDAARSFKRLSTTVSAS